MHVMDGPAATEQIEAAPPHYGAFISYSHLDLAAAKRLHRQLERYRMPQRLVGSATTDGPLSNRLPPIFRDIDELPASDDLSAEIQAALADSAALIVVASPAAKASRWVGREIETFRALHGTRRPVLIALIDGEPGTAFPDALAAHAIEPVAADFRKGHDGRRLALLKLVAGLTGASLDTLVQRDAQARLRRVTAITVAALIAVVVMAGLLVVTVRARAEADRQRNEAEGLVEYMLTDLREKLKGVDRLDVMTGVNERAMSYYGDQENLDSLPHDSLNRRARILHAMGEDDEKRGDLALALRKFSEAHRTTAAVLVQKPGDPDAIFAHAQSEFWVGEAAWRSSDFGLAASFWRAYLDQAISLSKVEPGSVRSLSELGFAHGNMCELLTRENQHVEQGLKHCASAVAYKERASMLKPDDPVIAQDLANRLGWMADALNRAGHHEEAIARRRAEQVIVDQLLRNDPKNVELRIRQTWPEIGLAKIELSRNRLDLAVPIFKQVLPRLGKIAAEFPDDLRPVEILIRTNLLLAAAQRKSGREDWKPARNRAEGLLESARQQSGRAVLRRYSEMLAKFDKETG
jgi:MTH538 TIR-like domain (DUF1863)